MPRHGNDFDRLSSGFSTPKSSNAGERQILEFQEDICKLFGYLSMILQRYRYRQSVIESTTTQVFPKNVRVPKWLVCGHFKLENLRYRNACTFTDNIHRSYLAQQRSPGIVIDGAMRNSKFAEESMSWIRLYLSDSGLRLVKPGQYSLGLVILPNVGSNHMVMAG